MAGLSCASLFRFLSHTGAGPQQTAAALPSIIKSFKELAKDRETNAQLSAEEQLAVIKKVFFGAWLVCMCVAQLW